MTNRACMAVALIAIGTVGINFFYASDLLMGGQVIELGPKSLLAVGAANILILAGLAMTARAGRAQPSVRAGSGAAGAARST